MKKIVFLSCGSLKGHVADDQLLVKELERDGIFKVSTVQWDSDHDWSQYDLAVIRTTWDYHHRPDIFLEKLKQIEKQTRLLNPMRTVEWNINKRYLRALEVKGVGIVPTVFFRSPEAPELPAEWKYKEFVIKPCISANAFKTIVLSRSELENGHFKRELHAGDWMLQPFLDEIRQGEYSFHYFNRKFSHAILKVPKPGDFRVQEEHGGKISVYTPTMEQLATCEKILAEVPGDLLYARVDLVPFQGDLVLMELELIEPALYFRMDKTSPEKFRIQLESFFNQS